MKAIDDDEANQSLLGEEEVERTRRLRAAPCVWASLLVLVLILCGMRYSSQPRRTASFPVSAPDSDSPNAGDPRRDAILEAFLHSWRGYEAHAFGSDELQPLSNKSNEHWGGFGVSLIDGLDTAMLMGQHGIASRATAWVDEHLHFDRDHYISVFEMTIRVLGGLVSSYDLSGDKRLLAKAVVHRSV